MTESVSDSEEIPQLPADTLAILEEFQRENLEALKQLRPVSGQRDSVPEVEISEDWQLSQFWYDEKTAKTLSAEALRCVGDQGRIALISCPTLYPFLKKTKGPGITVTLFEFDRRFSMYGNDFLAYDYRMPMEVPHHMASYFDLVIADPPFLSEECLRKVAHTIEFLSKGKIILCTGLVMQQLAKELLSLEKSLFVPCHKNNLGNEFGCFANYDIDEYISSKGEIVVS